MNTFQNLMIVALWIMVLSLAYGQYKQRQVMQNLIENQRETSERIEMVQEDLIHYFGNRTGWDHSGMTIDGCYRMYRGSWDECRYDN